jgi:hypothetical protein
MGRVAKGAHDSADNRSVAVLRAMATGALVIGALVACAWCLLVGRQATPTAITIA